MPDEVEFLTRTSGAITIPWMGSESVMPPVHVAHVGRTRVGVRNCDRDEFEEGPLGACEYVCNEGRYQMTPAN